MNLTTILCITATVTLAGCFTISDPTDSGFARPSSTGGLSETSRGRDGNDFSSLTGNGYGYQVGTVSGQGLQAFAGIVPGASVAAPPASGTAQLNGRFEVAFIDFILVNGAGTSVSGQSSLDSGTLSLTADFANGTLRGSGTGVDGRFVNISLAENTLLVDGRFDGEALTGTVTYDGVSGPLTGLVGSNEAIGAFHGHTDGQVHAGGFIVN